MVLRSCTRDRNALFCHDLQEGRHGVPVDRLEKTIFNPKREQSTTRRRGRRAVQYMLVFVGCVLVLDALVGEKGLLEMLKKRQEYGRSSSRSPMCPPRTRVCASRPAVCRKTPRRSRISPAASSASSSPARTVHRQGRPAHRFPSPQVESACEQGHFRRGVHFQTWGPPSGGPSLEPLARRVIQLSVQSVRAVQAVGSFALRFVPDTT